MSDFRHGRLDAARIRRLNRKPLADGGYVLYWMQQSARASQNHALAYATHAAAQSGLPLVVSFFLTSDFPHANLRHYRFMLEGLKETAADIASLGARFILLVSDPADGAVRLAEHASLCVVDRGYLRIQRAWRGRAAEAIECPMVEVESDVICPVETVSQKEEYAASTIRRKIHRELPRFLDRVTEEAVSVDSTGFDLGAPEREAIALGNPAEIEERLDLDTSVGPVAEIRGGLSQARATLARFIDEKLPEYHERRNEPSLDFQSHMSPYLHFGQISPLEIALAVTDDERAQDREAMVDGSWVPGRLSDGAQAYLEELIVRRELSMNFASFNSRYDSFDSIPDWAKRTIDDHRTDERPTTYSPEALEACATHDDYWNAAQREMIVTGKTHGYMRMYWGKKIIEWSKTPEAAHETMVRLNDRYLLDGRDANGYTGIAWCFGKHDRAWQEREIFGKLRYMNAKGLERKFDIAEYVRQISELAPGATR